LRLVQVPLVASAEPRGAQLMSANSKGRTGLKFMTLLFKLA
jgi:hypothetical protein